MVIGIADAIVFYRRTISVTPASRLGWLKAQLKEIKDFLTLVFTSALILKEMRDHSFFMRWGGGGVGEGRAGGIRGEVTQLQRESHPKKMGRELGGGHIKYFRGYKDGMSDGLLFK